MDIHEILSSARVFLEDFGLWTILLLLGKFITGVLVAIEKNEFKWYYLGNVFKNDLLKVAAYGLVLGLGRYGGLPEFNAELVKGGAGVLLAADLFGGVLKNLAHIFPDLANALPSSFREPARLRLGNPKNLV